MRPYRFSKCEVKIRQLRQTAPLFHLTLHARVVIQIEVPRNMTPSNADLVLNYSDELVPARTYVRTISSGAWRPEDRSYYARQVCTALGITMEDCRKIFRQVSPRGNVLNSIFVQFGIVTTKVYDYNERPEFLQFVLDYFIDQLSSGQKTSAADKSSVEALKKFKFGGGGCNVSDGQCAICIDDFEDEVELTKMPCLHAFHTDCLTKWLQMNHVCPLCRFPIPSLDSV